MYAEGKVGPPAQSYPPGALQNLRFGNDGALCNSDAQARFYEQAYRGKLFLAQTAVTGVAPGTSIGTTAAFALFNKLGSGVDVVVLQAALGYISGTLGAGTVSWCASGILTEAVPTGTAIVAQCGLIGKATPIGGSALTTATMASSPVPFRNAFNLQASLATTATVPWALIDDVDGAIILPPGGSVSLQGTTAAGSTPLVVYSVLWAEVPV